MWNVFVQPLGLLVFGVAAFAEAARLPFDLPEAEQELVGGYHTEYFGIKLLMYLVAEYLHMITAAFLIVILFLGGWHFWGLTGAGRDGDLDGGGGAGHRALGQGAGGDLLLHAGPLELAAVPLRPVDGAGLAGDVAAGAGQPGGGGLVAGVRPPAGRETGLAAGRLRGAVRLGRAGGRVAGGDVVDSARQRQPPAARTDSPSFESEEIPLS